MFIIAIYTKLFTGSKSKDFLSSTFLRDLERYDLMDDDGNLTQNGISLFRNAPNFMGTQNSLNSAFDSLSDE